MIMTRWKMLIVQKFKRGNNESFTLFINCPTERISVKKTKNINEKFQIDNLFQPRTVKSRSRLNWVFFLIKFQIQRVLLSM